MSGNERKQRILEMLKAEPADVFLRYAYALELFKEDDFAQGLELLKELTCEETPHVPSFFMSGQKLAAVGRTSDAREILRSGIAEARRQGDAHAAGEMSEFLCTLGDQPE